VTSELVVCNTGPAAVMEPSSTSDTAVLSAGIARRSLASVAARAPTTSSNNSVVVVIDDDTFTSDAATFSYVDDPVITDVIHRDSFLRSHHNSVCTFSVVVSPTTVSLDLCVLYYSAPCNSYNFDITIVCIIFHHFYLLFNNNDSVC